jgi:hypothetical protein
MNCRSCGTALAHTFVDLGLQPLSNAYVEIARAEAMEPHYPLHARVCASCWLVQVPQFETPEQIFSDYAYMSSVSTSWMEHCARYAGAMTARLGLGGSDLVIEIASNDGGLLRWFKERGVAVLGVEPAANIAEVARAAGIETITRFFGSELARELVRAGKTPRLIAANNVIAHVPDLNDFVAGLSILLPPSGVITVEFPHLVRLIAGNQFDTIYHEHFSYLSLIALVSVFERHGLCVRDVEELPTHGGSLRVFATHAGSEHVTHDRVAALLASERAAGLTKLSTYEAFSQQVHETKRKLLELLIREKRAGKRIVGYGAPAKGNTLLNYCGIRSDVLDFTVDRSPLKQGKLLPGTRIRVEAPSALQAARPDYVLILPWNIQREIIDQLAFIREWGGRFIIPIPDPAVVE